MRFIFTIAFLMVLGAGCGGGKVATRAGTPSDGKKPPADNVVRFSPCGERPCAYHTGSRTYRECLNGTVKQCFLFGRACEPGDHCMMDPKSQKYRRCSKPSAGACLEFGDVCKPVTARAK